MLIIPHSFLTNINVLKYFVLCHDKVPQFLYAKTVFQLRLLRLPSKQYPNKYKNVQVLYVECLRLFNYSKSISFFPMDLVSMAG